MSTTTESLFNVRYANRLLSTKKLSHNQLAKKTGIAQTTLSKMLTGRTSRPHKTNVEKLANFFEVPYDSLWVKAVRGTIQETVNPATEPTQEVKEATKEGNEETEKWGHLQTGLKVDTKKLTPNEVKEFLGTFNLNKVLKVVDEFKDGSLLTKDYAGNLYRSVPFKP